MAMDIYFCSGETEFAKININNQYCSKPSSFIPKHLKESQVSSACRKLQTLLGEWQQRGPEIKEIFSKLTISHDLDECLHIALKHKVEWSD
eukprot:UN28388